MKGSDEKPKIPNEEAKKPENKNPSPYVNQQPQTQQSPKQESSQQKTTPQKAEPIQAISQKTPE